LAPEFVWFAFVRVLVVSVTRKKKKERKIAKTLTRPITIRSRFLLGLGVKKLVAKALC
jgi:hypothetical protein